MTPAPETTPSVEELVEWLKSWRSGQALYGVRDLRLFGEAAAALARLSERVAEMEKDAARYRWLRDPANADVAELLFMNFDEDGERTEVWYQHVADSLDAEIDARIAEALPPERAAGTEKPNG